ncbi:MAG: Cellulosome-anchoring protein [Candidatus Peregrinibacteria bacterium GW2011_GWA2_43_8]|nr:MAG: Cellulosome-anchoring protein [Candidatus Peregrinibacteria bacterium GW2011_GWA2_43_8]
MKKIIIGCVTILIALNATLAYAQFTDVSEDNEYYYAISYLESNGTIAANADDLFYPDRDINKAEFYKMLLADSGFDPKGQKDADNQFDDLKGDEWYAPYANKAAKIGLIDLAGEPDNFYANRPITRGEAVKIMMEWAGIPIPMYIDEGDFDLPYKDTSYTNIYAPYIEMALSIGLMEPYNENYFGTYKKITRAEAAQLIYLFDSFAVTDAYLESIADEIRANLDIPYLLILEDVYTRLTEDYYGGGLNGEELMYSAIEGMVNSIEDVNTTYFLPDAATSFTQLLSGNFEGIGVYLQTNEDGTIEIMQRSGNRCQHQNTPRKQQLFGNDGYHCYTSRIRNRICIGGNNKQKYPLLRFGKFRRIHGTGF